MKNALIRVFIVAIIALGVALFYPDSPIYILNKQAVFDGKTVYQWMGELKSPDAATVRTAVRSIGRLGSDGEPALTDLARILTTSNDEELRKETAHALQKMAPVSAKVIDALTMAVKDESALVRMHVLLTMISLKQRSQPALDTLLTEVKNPKNQDRALGFTTTLQETMLVAIGYASASSDKGVPILMEYLLQDQNPGLKNAAMRGIAQVGPPAKGAAAELRKILKDPKSPNDLRQEAFDALAVIGEPAPKSDLVFVDPGPAIRPKGANPPGAGKGPEAGGKGFSPNGDGKGNPKGPANEGITDGKGPTPEAKGATGPRRTEGKTVPKETKGSEKGPESPK